MNPDPFANIPNADDSLNGEFSPAAMNARHEREFDIIERTGQAEYYLREARRAGLPLPGYVTISAHDHGGWRSSQIGIQLTSTDDVSAWALHFGTAPIISASGVSTILGDARHHEVQVYYMFPQADEKPVPPQPPMTDNVSGNYVPGLAEHTAAAVDTISKAAEIPGRIGTGQVADDDEESLVFADEGEYAE